jgi:hypothetical protein
MSNWNSTYQRTRRERNIAKACEFLGGQCVRCGEDDVDELEFDHSDPKVRSGSVSEIFRCSWKRIEEYLRKDKIQLLCKKCHLEKTMAEAA